ncbi:polymeric immunoglobulin receptor-like [Pimephales promelas]|nr:polymeric immunoglobulin receptor-like [Pimephales promelas]
MDHPDQSFFTVTMRNLQREDTGSYWCVEEIGGKLQRDETEKLHLTVQSAPDVSVMNSSVSGREGDDVSVQCFYTSGYQDKLKQWCRYKDKDCYTVGRTDTSQNSSVQISDDGRSSFTVLMTGLRLSDSGWYFCSAGNLQVSVQLTVTGVECFSGGTDDTVTIKAGGSVTIPCHYDEKNPPQKKYWYSDIDKSKIYTNTTEENLSVIDHPDQSLFTVTMRNLQIKTHNGGYSCAVETDGKLTVTYELHLMVQSAPDVSVKSSSVSGREGDNVSVQCFYTSGYQDKPKQWCRYKDQSCYTVGRTDTSQSSSVQISDDGRSSFTVLMTGLRLSDSGWYFCSAGEALNPVQLTVEPGVECYSGGSNIVTIKTGGSVTIPCHYDEKNPPQKKYWHSDIDQSKIYTNTREENLSVIDHPDQSLFTVTMRNLQNKHNGDYSCVVETDGKLTVTYELYLMVQSAPDVSVKSSSVSGHEGDDVSVQCFYTSGYQYRLKQWCRYKDQSCYTVGRTDTSQSSSVQISDDGRSSFTVLMTGLRLSDSGWYFCSAGEALNPVQLTVTEAQPEIGDTDNMRDLVLPSVWLLVSAALLLLLILLAVFTWRQRPEQDKHQNRERNDSIDAIYCEPQEPVIYSTINDEFSHDANKNITYSTICDVPGSEANKHNGDYSCAVENEGKPTVTFELHLKVQSAPDVSVMNSSVSGREGDNVSVQCFYTSGYKNKPKQWCRYKDKSCYTVGRTDTSQSSSVQISDDGRSSFTVLMTGLRLSDSGWYFCSAGEALNPVQLTVTEAVSVNTTTDNPRDVRETGNKNNNEAESIEEKQDKVRLSVWLPVSAALLLLLILLAVFTWRRTHKQDKHQNRERNDSRTIDAIYSKPEEDPVIYNTIDDERPGDPNKDVTYSVIGDAPPGSEAGISTELIPGYMPWLGLYAASEFDGECDDGEKDDKCNKSITRTMVSFISWRE